MQILWKQGNNFPKLSNFGKLRTFFLIVMSMKEWKKSQNIANFWAILFPTFRWWISKKEGVCTFSSRHHSSPTLVYKCFKYTTQISRSGSMNHDSATQLTDWNLSADVRQWVRPRTCYSFTQTVYNIPLYSECKVQTMRSVWWIIELCHGRMRSPWWLWLQTFGKGISMQWM